MIARIAVLAAVIAFEAPALAGDPPKPRPPLGPTFEMNSMLPDASNPMHDCGPNLATNRICIYNVGNQPLNITYWDGAKWQSTEIRSQNFIEPICSNCSGLIRVAFHDGRAVQNVEVPSGKVYWLGWDANASIWRLTVPPTR
jgi:hypothetical protein